MKNAKLIGILAIVIAAVLLASGALVGFDRGADIGGAYVLSVQVNEKFDVKDIEAIMKEAGATSCIVQTIQKTTVNEYGAGEGALISFEVQDDTKAYEVAEKAEQLLTEKYFLTFPGEFEFFSSTFNRQAAIDMWPALIVFAVLVAYVFIRFGLKMGFVFIADMFVPTAATAGIIALSGLKVTGFTIPSLLFTMALAFMFTFIFAMLLKNGQKKKDGETAFESTVMQVSKITLVASAVAIAAFTVMMIIGTTLLKNFAITMFMGTVLNLVTVLYVLPSLAKDNKKA